MQTNTNKVKTFNDIEKEMIKDYPILTNEDSVWLDVPEDQDWDIDVFMAEWRLKEMVYYNPIIMYVIELFDCELEVETNLVLQPFNPSFNSKQHDF